MKEKEIERMAAEAQETHKETNGKEGLIRAFLEREVPDNWESLGLSERRMFLNGNARTGSGQKLVRRDRICAMAVWAECFGSDPRYMQRRDSMEINGILQGLTGWEREKSPGRHGPYGIQRGVKAVST